MKYGCLGHGRGQTYLSIENEAGVEDWQKQMLGIAGEMID
jgi:hypothetical protein